MQALRHYLLAVQFFTRIPVTGRLADWVGYSPAMLRASAAHFPGIGWLAALLSTGVYAALHWALAPNPLTPAVAAVFCTIATVLMTGGFHEDGLADVADGLGGSADRERALDIMKDSRIGAFGAMALVLARFWPLLIVRSLPHVGDTARSKSKPLADQISGGALLAAFLWCFMPLALVYQAQSAIYFIASVLCSALAAAWMARWFARRLQGFTGDCLGATQQVSEIGFYLGAALALRWM